MPTEADSQRRRRGRARPNFDDLSENAQQTPQSVAQVAFPFFDECRAGNEFDQRRCARSRPARQRAASRMLWRANFFAQGLLDIGRYDFSRRRFELSVSGILTGPLGRGPVDAVGFLSTAPTRQGQRQAQTLFRQFVSIADEGQAEQWRRRNANLQQLRVAVLFRLGGRWSDPLPGRWSVWNPRTRRRRAVTRHNIGMLMRVVGVKIYRADTGEVLAETPSGPSIHELERGPVEEQANPEDFASEESPAPEPSPPPPPPPPAVASRPVDVSVGSFHSCALTSDRGVRCWGSNDDGQLGLGAVASVNVPTSVPGLSDVSAISCGYDHTCAVLGDRTVRCWGSNVTGQLGDGTGLQQRTPVAVRSLEGVTQLALGRRHSCALLASGGVRCWGVNEDGQVGDGTDVTRPLPVAVTGVEGATFIAAGAWHSCAVVADRTVRCWGDNENGQLGDGTVEPRRGAVAVRGLTEVSSLSLGSQHSCALRTNGDVLCWGQSGLRTNETLAPTLALRGAAQVAAGGRHTCARLNDGGVSCWGENGWNQLGDGTTVSREAPTPVRDLSDALSIAAGRWQHSCALTQRGVYCWGSGLGGMVGDGGEEAHPAPVAVRW